jgi:hypothetical protein
MHYLVGGSLMSGCRERILPVRFEQAQSRRKRPRRFVMRALDRAAWHEP